MATRGMRHEPRRNQKSLAAFTTGLFLAAAMATACLRDQRDVHAAREAPPKRPPSSSAQSYALCALIGPTTGAPGVYGTDLGYTAPYPHGDGFLAILFGDTWAKPTESCQHPVARHDDLQAWLPERRPESLRAGAPTGGEKAACKMLTYSREDRQDPTSWHRIRLFDRSDSTKEEQALDTGLLRTPVAAFSDGKRLYGIFYRGDPARCDSAADCPRGMRCSGRPEPGLGECKGGISFVDDPAPVFCRTGDDCTTPAECEPLAHGVCTANEPFVIGERKAAPPWYESDKRRAIARVMYIAASRAPEHPSDYDIITRFETNRFQNVVARTVRRFEPEHPEHNDYRPGDHTLLLWGRPAFVDMGGAQSLPFLLFVPLSELTGKDAAFRPRFFGGYDDAGRPRWVTAEEDALPVYGTETTSPPVPGAPIRWKEPEFDYVNQMTVSWIDPLKRWVMLYGGDVPAFLVTPAGKNEAVRPTHLQPVAGAIHMRSARHPWGRVTRNAPSSQAWSSPVPALTRRDAAPFLACGDEAESMPGCVEDGDPDGPFDLLVALASLVGHEPADELLESTGECVAGEVVMAGQKALSGKSIGRLYAPNIIDAWTADVTAHTPGLAAEERAAEIYWNASTWNPYQVALFKTVLRAPAPR